MTSEFAAKTRNPERAKTWVFAINDLLTNRPTDVHLTRACRDDFFRAFPEFVHFFACGEAELMNMRIRLSELRNKLVDYFNIPAAP